jgi:hypothetical protein
VKTVNTLIPLPKSWPTHVCSAILHVISLAQFARRPRIKPRQHWPRGSPCAKPQVDIDGDPGDSVIFEIDCHEGRRHLPIIRARRAA